jgi:hypothetical protein
MKAAFDIQPELVYHLARGAKTKTKHRKYHYSSDNEWLITKFSFSQVLPNIAQSTKQLMSLVTFS